MEPRKAVNFNRNCACKRYGAGGIDTSLQHEMELTDTVQKAEKVLGTSVVVTKEMQLSSRRQVRLLIFVV